MSINFTLFSHVTIVSLHYLIYLHTYFIMSFSDTVPIGVPAITFMSKSTTAFESEEVKLVCNATNYFDTDILQIKIVWYDPSGMQMMNPNESTTYSGNGINQYNITTFSTVDGQVESTLWFDMVDHTDSGEYVCRAFNHHQFYVEAMIKLIIECKTIIMYTYIHTYVY